MPPFQPKARVPVPAPTDPSSTGPVRADSSAARTCPGVIGRARMSFRPPSLVSPTTGLIERTPSIPSRASIHSVSASAAFHTHSVQVSRTGVSSSPSSRTWVTPSSLPNPLPTCIAAGTRSRKTLPPCGRMAVTPVRTRSPSRTVAWPTSTPSTSVIALCGPGMKMPGAIPRSRARGRGCSCAEAMGAPRPNPAVTSAAAATSRRGRTEGQRNRVAGDGRGEDGTFMVEFRFRSWPVLVRIHPGTARVSTMSSTSRQG